MSGDELRDRLARAMFNADNGAIVAWMDSDEPDILDTDRRIDGTINFAKLADVVMAELAGAINRPADVMKFGNDIPLTDDTIFTAQRQLDEYARRKSHFAEAGSDD